MPGGGDHRQLQGAHRDLVTVTHTGAVECHGVRGVDQIGHFGAAGELVAAGDVVVVDVGLGHRTQPQASLAQLGLDPVDVALGVDHQRDLSVVDHVAAVTELLGRDRLDKHPAPPA